MNSTELKINSEQYTDCPFRIAVVLKGIFRPNVENCTGFPHHQTVVVLEAELLDVMYMGRDI